MKQLINRSYQKVRNVASYVKKRAINKHITLRKILPHKTIILAGSARSGTTWLANIIAACRGFGIIFEPFHPREVPEAGNLPSRLYFS